LILSSNAPEIEKTSHPGIPKEKRKIKITKKKNDRQWPCFHISPVCLMDALLILAVEDNKLRY
jgi:hypothetical protein